MMFMVLNPAPFFLNCIETYIKTKIIQSHWLVKIYIYGYQQKAALLLIFNPPRI